jgi:hypothetical protein
MRLFKYLLIILLLPSSLFAQGGGVGSKGTININGGIGPNSGLLNLPLGWTYQQDVFLPCMAGTNSCNGVVTGETEIVAPTTANSTRVIVMQNGPTNVHINTIMTGATGENWQHAANCQVFNSGNDAMDVYYSIGGSGGNTSYTVTVTPGNFANNATVLFVEFMPPPGYTSSFDVCGTTTQGSCTTCTGVALPLSGTDAVLEVFDTSNMSGPTATGWNFWSSPFIADPNNNGIGLNISNLSTAPTFTQASSSFNTTIAIAFKSTAGTFNLPASVWSLVNYSEPTISGTLVFCNASCTFPIAQPTVGNLLFLNFSTAEGTGLVTLNSVSDPVNGSWIIPASCQQFTNVGQTSSLGCAYIATAASGSYGNPTIISVTLNTSVHSAFSVYEGHRTSGSTTLDAIGGTVRATSTEPYPPGITFSSLTGTSDICFQAGGLNGSVSGTTIYPYQGGSHAPNFGGPNGEASGLAVALLNTTNVNGPVWPYPVSAGSQVPVYGVCFK